MDQQDKPIPTQVSDIPLLPLRDVVVYPHMVIPLFVGRDKSIEALESAMSSDKQVLLVAQKNPGDDDPKADDLYSVGTVATILQLLDAQSRRISAESQLISARKERLANRVRLHVAMGGGLETQEVLQMASKG